MDMLKICFEIFCELIEELIVVGKLVLGQYLDEILLVEEFGVLCMFIWEVLIQLVLMGIVEMWLCWGVIVVEIGLQ